MEAVHIMKYQRYENESDEELIYRVCKDKDLIGTWTDVADILNELLGQEYTESKYRKRKKDKSDGENKLAVSRKCNE
jgi:hypothetical protein